MKAYLVVPITFGISLLGAICVARFIYYKNRRYIGTMPSYIKDAPAQSKPTTRPEEQGIKENMVSGKGAAYYKAKHASTIERAYEPTDNSAETRRRRLQEEEDEDAAKKKRAADDDYARMILFTSIDSSVSEPSSSGNHSSPSSPSSSSSYDSPASSHSRDWSSDSPHSSHSSSWGDSSSSYSSSDYSSSSSDSSSSSSSWD